MIELINDNIGKQEINDLIEWLSGYPRLTKGPLTVEFEKKWSEYIGCKHSVFVNSGSSANLIALATAKLSLNTHRNNRIVIPSICWLTDYSPAIQLGLDVYFADINLDNLSVDLDKLEQLFHWVRPQYFMLVSVLGIVPDMKRIIDLCKQYDVILIGDHCETFGAEFEGKMLGNCGEFCSTFSLYYGHHLSTIEGGMVCTNDDNFYEKLLMMRSHGWLRDLNQEQAQKYQHEVRSDFHKLYTFFEPGFNLRATDLQAFLGINQLKKAEAICDKRREIFDEYHYQLQQHTWVPKILPNSVPSPFAFPLILKDAARVEKLRKLLFDNEIQSRPLISGSMMSQPLFRKFNHVKQMDTFLNAKKVDECGMYVPCHPDMTKQDVNRICDIIKRVENE